MITIMTHDFPLAQPGLQDGTGSDIVNKGIRPHDDADVPEPVSVEIPGNKISRQVGALALFHPGAMAPWRHGA